VLGDDDDDTRSSFSSELTAAVVVFLKKRRGHVVVFLLPAMVVFFTGFLLVDDERTSFSSELAKVVDVDSWESGSGVVHVVVVEIFLLDEATVDVEISSSESCLLLLKDSTDFDMSFFKSASSSPSHKKSLPNLGVVLETSVSSVVVVCSPESSAIRFTKS